ncbi:hypothetical protein NPIL_286331, partial [Nephila pilipes]
MSGWLDECYNVDFGMVGLHRCNKRCNNCKPTLGICPDGKSECHPGRILVSDQDKIISIVKISCLLLVPCAPGSYSSGQETECFLCPKNFYINKEAADACWPCPSEKKTLREGADSVDLCV